MHLQQYQQSMQNQLAAMDQHANRTDKILRRLVKECRHGKKKHRHDERDGGMRSDSDGASSDSSSDN